MRIEFLCEDNIDKLVDFELEARMTEPEIFLGEFNGEEYKAKISKSLIEKEFLNTKVLIAYNEEKVIGRIDLMILASLMDGGKRGYVDWIYVLKEYRHNKVAQELFKKGEEYLKSVGVNDYFLIVARNHESQSFYHSFNNCNIETSEILNRDL